MCTFVHYTNHTNQEKTMANTELTRMHAKGKKIIGAYTPDPKGAGWRVGNSGVTEITPYEENGEQAFIPRIKIYKGETLVATAPANQFVIDYAE